MCHNGHECVIVTWCPCIKWNAYLAFNVGLSSLVRLPVICSWDWHTVNISLVASMLSSPILIIRLLTALRWGILSSGGGWCAHDSIIRNSGSSTIEKGWSVATIHFASRSSNLSWSQGPLKVLMLANDRYKTKAFTYCCKLHLLLKCALDVSIDRCHLTDKFWYGFRIDYLLPWCN